MTSPDAPGPRLFVVAGEPSGDLHAANLLREIRGRAPGVEVRGFGGERMRAEGMEILEDLPAQAIMGLFPVIAALPRIKGWFKTAVRELERTRPDALILVDYPGFNLRLAKKAHALGIPVIYYISPQVWAWNRGRVKTIARIVDLMIVILPFEEEFYRDSGVNVFYAGHPLIDHLQSSPVDQDAVAAMKERGGTPLVGVFPGSRRHVVRSLGGVFVDAAKRLVNEHGLKDARFVFAAAKDELAAELKRLRGLDDLNHEIVVGQPYEVMSASDLCLTTSGTTTLEIAAFETPMVLAYRVSPVFYGIGRMVIRVKHIGLVNLIAGKTVVPEHIGVRAFDKAVAEDLASLWKDTSRRDWMTSELKDVRRKLETSGSYAQCAQKVLDFVSERASD